MSKRKTPREMGQQRGRQYGAGMHVIIAGNPGDGFTIYGPFNNATEAAEQANDDAHLQGDWWVLPLEAWEI